MNRLPYLLTLLLIGFFIVPFVHAQTATPTPSITINDAQNQLEQQITDYQNKLTDLGKQKNTLNNQIQIIDSQIQLTLLKINQSQAQITRLESDINDLTGKIGVLDTSLNQLSNLYLQQVAQNYKLQKRIPSISLFFANTSFNHFLEQYKYLAVTQKNSQNTLVSMETVRTNYDQEKSLKETKQNELQELQKKLNSQQKSLSSQKTAKDQLLQSTKNDEKKYQQLLAEAIIQLNALRNFSSSAGGSTCLSSIPGGGSDGNYYSQRDPRWCKQYIGNSQDTVGAVGCYISSITMAYKKLGKDLSPSLYAADPGNFRFSTAYALDPAPPDGYIYKISGYNASTIDNEIKNGRYVIAQLRMVGSISGMHFIVIIGGSNGNYKIHDPWFGSDLDFNSHYTTSQIMSLRLFTK